ncbi:MAG TPA: patatin-like phospholipase family protein [Flavobacterium sp.]|nr:patatin-like phospholipase family protein [Flavobacterium sp.]
MSQTDTIGLVLSGGGTKGLAHAGVLKFLEEQQIKPTQIAGTSAGAIVGSLYAFGKTPEEILAFFKAIYFFHWRHFTIRKAGIIDSDSFKNYFQGFFKEATIGDATTDLHITATDLIKGRLKIFDKDTLVADALLASSSFPGVISPYNINGDLYSDGGILNHFPTDVLLGKCDTMIGVYVSPINDVQAKDLNSIRAVTVRAFDLLSANNHLQKFNNCDWLIEPKQLSHYGTFETNKSKMDEIFNIGYETAKKNFKEFKGLNVPS